MAVSRILTLLALTAVSTLVAAEHGDTTCTMQPQPQLGKHMALVQLTNRLRSTGSKPNTLTDFERDYIEDGRGPCCTEQRAECLSCAEDIAVIAWCEDPRHTDVPGCEGIPTTSHRAYHSSWRHAGSEQGASDYAYDGAQDGAAGHGGAGSNATGHGGGFAAHGADGADGADGAGGSTTTTVSTTTTTVIECVTREDPRVSAVGYTTSPPGTPCVFGVDARDEGEHCIFDSGAYGSFGWCYTSDAGDSWGSCAESCPLFGPSKVLGERIEHLEKKIAKALSTTTTTSSSSSSTTTNTTTTTTTTTTTASTTEAPSTSTTASSTTSKATTSTTVQVSTSMEESNATTATTSTTITTTTSAATNATKNGPGAHSVKSGGPGAKGGSSSDSETSDTDSDMATKGGSSSDADMTAKE